MVREGRLRAGHARRLLALPADAQYKVALQIEREKLSVRDVESLVRNRTRGIAPGQETVVLKPSPSETTDNDANIRALERQLSDLVGSPVVIEETVKGRGFLKLLYFSYDELDGLMMRLGYRSDDTE